MIDESPKAIATYYSHRLAEHGDTAQGAGWPNAADRATRFDVMAAVAGADLSGRSICDLGCGTGAFLEHLTQTGRAPAEYVGIDICPDAIARARQKFPQTRFHCMDVLTSPMPSLDTPVDYAVMNGLFTVKDQLSQTDMWAFMAAVLDRIWPCVTKGLAFNVMSDVVDWRRDDLFHVPMDDLARHLFGLAGRRVVFRTDYDLYEYTAYVYRVPVTERP